MAKATKTVNDMISARQLAEQSGESYDTIDHWTSQDLLVFKRRGRTRLFAQVPILDVAQCDLKIDKKSPLIGDAVVSNIKLLIEPDGGR